MPYLLCDENARRCAHALGWEEYELCGLKIDGRPEAPDGTEWLKPTGEPGHYDWKCYDLSHDPEFWFPKLWDTIRTHRGLRDLAHRRSVMESVIIASAQCDYRILEVCVIICEHIEQLGGRCHTSA